MAEVLAILKAFGPFISPIISKLAEKASPYFGGDVTAEKLDHLRTIILPQILLVIDAAGEDEIAILDPWLRKLKAAAFEAEDVFDKWEYRRLEDQFNPPHPVIRPISKSCKKLKDFAAPIFPKTKLMKKLDELEKIASGVDKFMNLLRLHKDFITNQNDDRSRDQSTPSLPPIVVGRTQERKYWVHVLTSPADEKPQSSTQRCWTGPIHAICGIGGAGKTTLAQDVFNDPEVKKQFGDMRIWVHVPHKLDVGWLTRKMIELLTKGECSIKEDNIGALQAKLKEIFENSKNKILLVLDDLWDDKSEDRIQLDILLQPLNEVGRTGSKVLITTRMERVALILGATNIVSLKDLEDEHCRSIILHYANRRKNELNEDEVEILNKIVSKLKKSPLAARVVGNQLGGKKPVDAWSTILKGDVLESSKNALLWSFKRLPIHLKSCFALCSLYPKGFNFSRKQVDKLVRLWIVQGFIKEPTENEDMTIEEKGWQYFRDLLSFSFFQPDPYEEGGYVMHDLLHDLAEDVSKGHCFRIEDNKAANIPLTVIHLSIDASNRLTGSIFDFMKLANLRTFFIFNISGDDFDDIIKHGGKMFTELTKLRFMHFGGFSSEEELNSSIGKLMHLRYLQAYGWMNLPESLGTLYHLQYLCLYRFIERLPGSLNNLGKLRYVDGYKAHSKIKIEDIGKLTSLQKLEVYNAGKTKQYGLQQLEKLQHIRGQLTIEGLECVKDKAGGTIAMLNTKRHLEELILVWDDSRVADMDIDRDEAVLEGLEPHPNLKKLKIMHYNGARPPSWMLDDRLPNLTSLLLWNCRNLTGVPNLPCRLRVLTVRGCPKLMQLYPYPCGLEELELTNCPGLSSVAASYEGGSYNKREQKQQQHLMGNGSSIKQPFTLRSLMIVGRDDCILEENTLNEFLMNEFRFLSKLEFEHLPSITSLLLGPHLIALEILFIYDLKNLRSVKVIGSVSSLKHLEILGCSNLDSLPDLPSSLESLRISCCSKIESLSNLPSSLESLRINNCGIDSLPNLPSSLNSLEIEECSKIESLPNLPSSLESLEIEECSKIESLPNMPSSLKLLWINKCHPQLKASYQKGGPLRHKINHITDIVIR